MMDGCWMLACCSRQENTDAVCQMLGLRVHIFSLSLLYFFYSLRACGHPVLTCWQCRGLAERLFGLLAAPSFRQLCKEELGLCGYHWHVRGSEYRFYLFPPPTSFFSFWSISLPLFCSACRCNNYTNSYWILCSLKAMRPRHQGAGCKQSWGGSSSRTKLCCLLKRKKNDLNSAGCNWSAIWDWLCTVVCDKKR